MKHVARWFSDVAWPAAVASLGSNQRELVFAMGIGLVAYGLSLFSMPAAFIVPGTILVWLAIPPTVKRSK